MSQYEMRIAKDTLTQGNLPGHSQAIPMVVAANEYYKLTLMYWGGDYPGELANGTLKRSDVSITVDPLKDVPEINFVYDEAMIVDDIGPGILPDRLDSYIGRLQTAKECIPYLRTVIKTYFPQLLFDL